MTSELKVFTLPDVGEGLAEARVLEFLVEPGDSVENLDPLVEVETDKAVTALTSPWAGRVASLIADVDSWVEVGGALLEIEVSEETDL